MSREEYSTITLKSGMKAVIVEILEDGVAYEVDVSKSDGWPKNKTITVLESEILSPSG